MRAGMMGKAEGFEKNVKKRPGQLGSVAGPAALNGEIVSGPMKPSEKLIPLIHSDAKFLTDSTQPAAVREGESAFLVVPHTECSPELLPTCFEREVEGPPSFVKFQGKNIQLKGFDKVTSELMAILEDDNQVKVKEII
ncbi:hypothetical protein BTVI_154158 [Pitangus sulphuratus]|nr:hypothetical protein BTVI_154158 [Pitangus sulphuratus]